MTYLKISHLLLFVVVNYYKIRNIHLQSCEQGIKRIMLFQRKSGSDIKKEEGLVKEDLLITEEKPVTEKKPLKEDKLIKKVKPINEKALAKFEADIKFFVLWHALENLAHHQIYINDRIAVWNKIAEEVKLAIRAHGISLVDKLVLDGEFMKVSYYKYMNQFVAKYGNGVDGSKFTLDNDVLLSKLHKSRFIRYDLMAKLGEVRYERTQTERYLAVTAASEKKVKSGTKTQEINGSERLKEELKSKDKTIDELTLEIKGLLKSNEELKNIRQP